MSLNETFLPAGVGTVSTPNYMDWRAQNRSFEELAAYHPERRNLQGVDNPERIPAVADMAPTALTWAVTAAVRVVAPDQRIFGVKTM